MRIYAIPKRNIAELLQMQQFFFAKKYLPGNIMYYF